MRATSTDTTLNVETYKFRNVCSSLKTPAFQMLTPTLGIRLPVDECMA